MADIKNMHPVLQDLANKFVEACKTKGVNVAITQGFRSIAYQNGLYAQGRTAPGNRVTNCPGGQSPHNYGLAFDFCVIGANGKPDWSTKNKNWSIAGVIGESLGLEWGGRWTQFVDLPHLQYMFGLTIKQLQRGIKPPTTQRVATPKEMAGLAESQLIRIGKTVYKKL